MGGVRHPVDVLYRRFDDGMLAAFRTPTGQSLDLLLTEAVRSGGSGWPTSRATTAVDG